MKDPLKPRLCAEKLSALAAPERLQIVQVLREGPSNVSDLAQRLKMSMVNVSHHLGVLRHAGLVRFKKQGRFMVYSLPPQVFKPEEGGEHIDLGCCRLEMPSEQK
jgi:DNA-binding transcriptional ArsR family regulator